jgi:hypothetical protein
MTLACPLGEGTVPSVQDDAPGQSAWPRLVMPFTIYEWDVIE